MSLTNNFVLCIAVFNLNFCIFFRTVDEPTALVKRGRKGKSTTRNTRSSSFNSLVVS